MVFALNWEMIDKMARDTTLALHALTYVIKLHADLTSEHGAPLGTQNQAVDFILADPELSRAVATWAAMTNIGEAPAHVDVAAEEVFVEGIGPLVHRMSGDRSDRTALLGQQSGDLDILHRDLAEH